MSSRAQGPTAERIQRIENGLLPEPFLRGEQPEPASLLERMDYHKVPGVNIAVIDNYELDWARAYGAREAGGAEPVDPRTLFQAASISKPVTVIAALRLVQEGRLDLDEDVNTYLTSWKVSANGPWQPRVTIRQLMSHTGGTTVHGFPGYRRDHPRPTLLQVLDGQPPSNTPAIRVNALPGTQFRYSGGGTTILQQALLDLTGRSFPELMRELVLDPLGLADSTYEQPLPEARWASAATGHRTGGGQVHGKWHVYPEIAAAGLWTTPSDLAQLALEIQRTWMGEPPRLVTRTTVEQMLTPQVESPIGLGFFLVGLDGKDESLRFQHSGGNEGFRCHLVAYRDRGQGAVVMTNGDEGGALLEEIIRAIAKEYAWPGYPPSERQVVGVGPEIYADYVGEYELRSDLRLLVAIDGGALFLRLPDQPAIPLYPLSETEFFARAVDVEITFARSGSGRVEGLTIRQNQEEMRARRID